MTISCRAYVPADRDACLAVFDSNVPTFFDPTERAGFQEFLAAPDGCYFVLEDAGEVVGCGGYADDGDGIASFTWGMVQNDRHGQQLGRKLAEYRLARIAEDGSYSSVKLCTTPDVEGFFNKFGFERQSFEKDGYAPGMDRVEMLRASAD